MTMCYEFVELFRFHLVVLPGGHGARFYHIVWPFYVAILISPYHGDLEKARVMLRGVNPGAGLGSHYAHMWAISDFVPVLSIGSH